MWISSNLTSTWNLKFKKQKQIPIYWELSASGVQVDNFDMEEEDEDYEIHKP